MVSMTRLRAALAEVSLALIGLLAGYVGMLVVAWLGVIPRAQATSFGLVAGPGIHLVAWLVYRIAAARMDESADPAHVAEPPRHTMVRGTVVSALVVLVIGVALAIAGSYGLGQLMDLLGYPVAEQPAIQRIAEAYKRGEGLVEVALLCVSAGAFAPIVEELFYRGQLFRRVALVSGATLAYGLSALAFAAVHQNPAGFVIYTWLGLVFAACYARTGRIWVPMGIHMGNNLFALAALFLT